MSSGKRAGDWQISCKRETREEDVNSIKDVNPVKTWVQKCYLRCISAIIFHMQTQGSVGQISLPDIKICTRDRKFPLWLNELLVMQVSWPQARQSRNLFNSTCGRSQVMLPCSLTIGVELSQNRVVSSEGKSGSSNKVSGPDCGLPSSFMTPASL